MDKLWLETSFRHARCGINADTKTIASGTLRNGLYHSDLVELLKTPVRAMIVTFQRWHERLAHADQAGIKRMIDYGVVKGAAINSNENPEPTAMGASWAKAIELLSPRKVIPAPARSSISYTLTPLDLLMSSPLEVHASSSHS
jgi:hypothetical protein